MHKPEEIKEALANLQLTEGEGFVTDEGIILEAYEKSEANKSGIAIKILSIFGGVLATLAFMGFLGLARIFESEPVMFVLGLGFIVAALAMDKVYDKLIIDTFSISLFIIGYVLIGVSLAGWEADWNTICLIYIVMAGCCLVVTQNYMLSFIAILIAAGSLLGLIGSNKQYDLIHVYISGVAVLLTYWVLNEAQLITGNKKLTKLYNPVRIGLLFSLLAGLAVVCKRGLISVSPQFVWASSVVIIALVVYLVSKLLVLFKVESPGTKLLVYAACVLLLIPTAFSPAISGALLILLLSFWVNYKTGLVIGIVSLAYFIGQYYYDLNFTLLTKSGILFTSGVLFILFYFFMHKKFAANEEV